jgi:hypothetical protein
LLTLGLLLFKGIDARADTNTGRRCALAITLGLMPTRRFQLRSFIAVCLCMTVGLAAVASEGGYKVNYDGGSITALKSGEHMKLFMDGDHIRVVHDATEVLSVPASAVTEISYGQDVHRRVGAAIGLATVSLGVGALMALTKSKKHFIGLAWDDAGHKGGIAFQADKSNYRGLLAGLEGITGKKAINSDAMTVKN